MNMTEKNQPPALVVLYDGSCPLCRREIGVYQNLRPYKTGKLLKFLDISLPESVLPVGGVRSAYLARFHVVRPNGQVLSGAAAFVALWATLPGWRYIAWVARLPAVTPLLEMAYRAFLLIRPPLQNVVRSLEAPRVSKELVSDLRSDHAGETGAVWIYHGLLATSNNPVVREFAYRHRATEQMHLNKINALLPWLQRSRLLPGWRLAGFLTGALPALFGPRAVFATIAAVETFVNKHYQHQIDKLQNQPEHAELLNLLLQCQLEECEHRDEALAMLEKPPGWLLKAWCALVRHGSAGAVGLARRV